MPRSTLLCLTHQQTEIRADPWLTPLTGRIHWNVGTLSELLRQRDEDVLKLTEEDWTMDVRDVRLQLRRVKSLLSSIAHICSCLQNEKMGRF
jgi:gamma-glutamyl phosphate reductase